MNSQQIYNQLVDAVDFFINCTFFTFDDTVEYIDDNNNNNICTMFEYIKIHEETENKPIQFIHDAIARNRQQKVDNIELLKKELNIGIYKDHDDTIIEYHVKNILSYIYYDFDK